MRIESDRVTLFDDGSRSLILYAINDSIELHVASPRDAHADAFVYDRQDIERLQLALLNYLNTGRFDKTEELESTEDTPQTCTDPDVIDLMKALKASLKRRK